MYTCKIRCRGVIFHEEKLLLVKHSGGRDFYALPGGHLDSGEDPKECIEREIFEELGIKPTLGRLLYVHTFVKREDQSIEFFFEIINDGDFLGCENNKRTHAHEIDEIIWASPRDCVRILPERFCKDFENKKILSDQTQFFKSGVS